MGNVARPDWSQKCECVSISYNNHVNGDTEKDSAEESEAEQEM